MQTEWPKSLKKKKSLNLRKVLAYQIAFKKEINYVLRKSETLMDKMHTQYK